MILSDMQQADLRLDAFIPYRLSFTATLVSESIAGAYERLFQISIPEWRVIAWLAETGGITQQEICERTRMDKVTVSRAAIALAKRGLVEKTAHPEDGRSHLLTLSEAGKSLHAQIAPKALELERRIFGRFGSEQLRDFVRFLQQIDQAVLDVARTSG